jgi:hypothetical protein
LSQVDFTTAFNVSIEDEGLAMTGCLKVIILQTGYLTTLNEGRIKDSDQRYVLPGKASGFFQETQLTYDQGIHFELRYQRLLHFAR